MSVADALRVALPQGTRVAYGHQHLRQTISWVRAFVSRPYVLGSIERDTLVILSIRGLTSRPEVQRLPRLVEALVQAGISALVLTEDSAEVCEAAARADAIPVLVLPPDAVVLGVERAMIGLIIDRESQIQRHAGEVHQQLVHLALSESPVGAMAEALAQSVGRVVYVEDEHGTLQTVAAPLDHAAQSLPSVDEAISVYSARAVLGLPSGHSGGFFLGNGPVRRLLGDTPYEVYSAPIGLGGALAGFLTLLGRANEMQDIDEQVVLRGASAFAIPIARQRAIIETQTRLQGSFLESLFAGAWLSEDEIADRARYLGHNLREVHETACVTLDESPNGRRPSEAERAALWASFLDMARRHLLERWPQALVKDRGELLAVLVPSEDAQTASSIKESLEGMRTQLCNLAGDTTATVGVGRRAAGPREILRSYLQAEQAAQITRRFLGGNQTIAFDELGAYRLLASIEDREALAAFHDEYLGPLEAYDNRTNAELVSTLDGFFAANGNHARAAEALHLHRNTLLYRLGRIETLLGRDLDDPETRLCVQLALKIRHLAPPGHQAPSPPRKEPEP